MVEYIVILIQFINIMIDKSKTNQDLFIDFNIHSDDPDDINQEKINIINNG